VPSLKSIRKRIVSVKSTQKITRAMKMVAGARLNKAQTRITELRPYAVKTQAVLAEITVDPLRAAIEKEAQAAEEPALPADEAPEAELVPDFGAAKKSPLDLLDQRAEKRVLLVVLTSDRGLCGAFNTNINKRAEREWKTRSGEGQEVKLAIIGRKGRDYMARRGAPIFEYFAGVWEKLDHDTAQTVGKKVLEPFYKKEIDAIYLVYNEFKSAMSQMVVVERLLPVTPPTGADADAAAEAARRITEFLYEPNREALLTRLIPMYVDISILRALYESQASELGARMTAMDSATKNAKEMIQTLTLQYNKARQAAITKELMEIIGGSEALKE
jgi:F-type H+-transporting ATPase subunit gamma